MTARARYISANAGNRGKLDILFAQPQTTADSAQNASAFPKLHFSISGADAKINTVTSLVSPYSNVSALDQDADGWILQNSATVSIDLSNLGPQSPVTVQAFYSDSTEAKKKVPVPSIILPVVTQNVMRTEEDVHIGAAVK